MNYTVRRIPLDETEDRALKLAAEKAFRRPEQQARWLLRQVLGLTEDQPSTLTTNRDADHALQAAGVSQ